MQFRTVWIAQIKSAWPGLAQVLRQRVVEVDDRVDLSVQKGWFASEVDPAQSGGNQADVAVRVKHDGSKHSLEAIPLLQ